MAADLNHDHLIGRCRTVADKVRASHGAAEPPEISVSVVNALRDAAAALENLTQFDLPDRDQLPGFEVEVDLAAGPSGPVTEAWKTFRTPVLPAVNTAMELDGEKFAIHATRFQFNQGTARIGLLVTRIGSVLAVSASALDRLNNLGAPK